MKIGYILFGPQSFDIKPYGAARSRGVEFALKKLMGLDVPLAQIGYGDDMLTSMLLFHESSLLMCPSNAQEEAKELVRERRGFVSEKRSAEAVAEFLAEVYPKQCRDKHPLIHSIYFDKDGVLWEEERLSQNLPFFPVIADYVRNCQGPYTDYPPVSIATGGLRKSVLQLAKYIGLIGENIPAKFHRENTPLAWPPIIFEDGCLAMDPVAGKVFDLTEEKYGLFSPDFKKTAFLIIELGKKISKRVPEINRQLGAKCKIIFKERGGYTLDLPFEARGNRDDLKGAHSVIYRNVRDLLPEGTEFVGLFTREEIESER